MRRPNKKLDRALVDATEREKQMLAVELHEGLAQALTGVSLHAEVLSMPLRKGRPIAIRLADFKGLHRTILHAVEEIRFFMNQAFPRDLEQKGLLPTLQELTASTAKRVACEFVYQPRLVIHNPAVSLALIRIVQEAIRDALHRSKASRIRVSLQTSKNTVALEIRDNGWFTSPLHAEAVYGAEDIMQIHVRLVGGTLKRKRTKKGARIACVIPNRPSEEP